METRGGSKRKQQQQEPPSAAASREARSKRSRRSARGTGRKEQAAGKAGEGAEAASKQTSTRGKAVAEGVATQAGTRHTRRSHQPSAETAAPDTKARTASASTGGQGGRQATGKQREDAGAAAGSREQQQRATQPGGEMDRPPRQNRSQGSEDNGSDEQPVSCRCFTSHARARGSTAVVAPSQRTVHQPLSPTSHVDLPSLPTHNAAMLAG